MFKRLFWENEKEIKSVEDVEGMFESQSYTMFAICFSQNIPRGTSKYPEVPQCTQKYLKVTRNTSKYLEVPHSSQKYLKVPRSTSK